jgi:hypothetical protein
VPRGRKGQEAGEGDGTVAGLAEAEGEVVDPLEGVVDFGDFLLRAGQEGQRHLMLAHVGRAVAGVQGQSREVAQRFADRPPRRRAQLLEAL